MILYAIYYMSVYKYLLFHQSSVFVLINQYENAQLLNVYWKYVAAFGERSMFCEAVLQQYWDTRNMTNLYSVIVRYK